LQQWSVSNFFPTSKQMAKQRVPKHQHKQSFTAQQNKRERDWIRKVVRFFSVEIKSRHFFRWRFFETDAFSKGNHSFRIPTFSQPNRDWLLLFCLTKNITLKHSKTWFWL
jgi:hypothetical protein